MIHNKKIVVVGATGRVGREMLKILKEYNVPRENIMAVASSKSLGVMLEYGEDEYIEVESLENFDFKRADIGLFSAGSEISKIYAIKASDQGCVVIDNTSYFRMFDNIPLIVPEVNFEDLKKYDNPKIISNPNCSTIQMVVALKPLHDAFNLKEINVSTYQATSGAGQKGVDELMSQTKNIIEGNNNISINHFKKQIAFNVIPQIDSLTDSRFTKEELKMMNETRKIMNLENLDITSTCVRVPVIEGHSESIFARFEKNIDLKKVFDILNNTPGIKVVDNTENYEYSTPIESNSRNEVFISRIRKYDRDDKVLLFWCVSNNVRKGAALNAIQIADKL